MHPSMKLDVVYETVLNTLDGFHEPNSVVVHTGGEYDYYSITGNTVVFFKQLPGKMYHIVLCEIDEKVLSEFCIKHDDLINDGYTFTF